MPPRFAEANSAVIAGTASCAECGRTPLVGEWATLFGRGRFAAWVCDLCAAAPEAARHGHKGGRSRVRSRAAANVRRVS